MKREKFTPLQKNYTATGSDGIDKSHLCEDDCVMFPRQKVVGVKISAFSMSG